MPSETRYMSNDKLQQTPPIYELKTTQSESSDSEAYLGSGNLTVQWGIRVWKDGVEITSGSPVAVVQRSADGEGLQNNTWGCPQTDLDPADEIEVKVYVRFTGQSWFELCYYKTDGLNADSLDAATWTVYYYTKRSYDSKNNQTTGIFFWGANKDSRVENFTYTPAGLPPPAGYQYSDGLVCVQVVG